jgi:hypothetical protein
LGLFSDWWTRPIGNSLAHFVSPTGVISGQMVRVVVNYIDRHPETMHLRFSALAFDALKEVWPCKS